MPPHVAVTVVLQVPTVTVEPLPPPVPGPAYTFFDVALQPTDAVIFVLDRSGSMLSGIQTPSSQFAGTSAAGGFIASLFRNKTRVPTKLETVKAELLNALAGMPDGARFNVVFFDDGVWAFADRVVAMTPEIRAQARAAVAGIQPGGSTAALPALQAAIAMGGGRLVLLSDGLANSGGSGDDVLDQARGWIRAGVVLDTIGAGGDQDAQLLRALASESGGRYVPL